MFEISMGKEDFKKLVTRDKFIEMLKIMASNKINKDDYVFSYAIIGSEVKEIIYPDSKIETTGLIDTDKDDNGKDIKIYFSPYMDSSKYLMGFSKGTMDASAYVYIPLEKYEKGIKGLPLKQIEVKNKEILF